MHFVYGVFIFSIVVLSGCGNTIEHKQKREAAKNEALLQTPMLGEFRSRKVFENPYANIPPQCYVETSYGTQNACLFCHSNAAARQKLGNTLPQAGASSFVGNLQLVYAFGPVDPFTKSPNINPWENMISPQKLERAFESLDIDESHWEMQKYITSDNWQRAYEQKRGDKRRSNSDVKSDAFRLFPALNPEALPADSDGFVRTKEPQEALFKDAQGFNTGWRSINFMPYGIFTPHSGSVSGVYIRLDTKFMKTKEGVFDLDIYKTNLTLLEKAIQDRLENDEKYYVGEAGDLKIERGLFPLKTEFAHPLHYVDVSADGKKSKFPGLRASRVKEVRYMYKYKMYYPGVVVAKEEDAPLYHNAKESWMDNGAGWYLSAFIEDEQGELRGQSGEELLQCVGCHSTTFGFEPTQFTSGTGSTIDSTWAFARKFPNALGWKEMDYLGYEQNHSASLDETAGYATMGDPINRDTGVGELRYFLDHVVGASLYGEMPKSMQAYLGSAITQKRGYSADFPSLRFDDAQTLKSIQKQRLQLMRDFTKRGDYLTEENTIQGALIYPTFQESMVKAKMYRRVVATQRYTKGKDYFGKVIYPYRYYRDKNESFTHSDGRPYKHADVITDRPYDRSESMNKGVGNTLTLIKEDGGNYDAEYLPLLSYPLRYQKR